MPVSQLLQETTAKPSVSSAIRLGLGKTAFKTSSQTLKEEARS